MKAIYHVTIRGETYSVTVEGERVKEAKRIAAHRYLEQHKVPAYPSELAAIAKAKLYKRLY